MGMSTRVIGYRSNDEPTYRKHANVLRACVEAGIQVLPDETALYFGEMYPDLYLLDEKLEITIPCKEFSADMEEGYEVFIADIPQGVNKIRFVNSY